MNSTFRTTCLAEKGYPCRQPAKRLNSGLLNPIPSKTICTYKLKSNEVDMRRLQVCAASAGDVDVSGGITDVSGCVSAGVRQGNNCCGNSNSLTVSNVLVDGDINVGKALILQGSRLCSPLNSKGPLLLSQEKGFEDFWHLHPSQFEYGETLITCTCSHNSPISCCLKGDACAIATSTKRFCNNVIQMIVAYDCEPIAYECEPITFVRAALDSHTWSELRKLEVSQLM